MAIDDQNRLRAHAVITNSRGHVLLLEAACDTLSWGLPGGAFEPVASTKFRRFIADTPAPRLHGARASFPSPTPTPPDDRPAA